MSLIKDPSLATWGRQEMILAEHEMPGLMSCRTEFGAEKPLNGARISGSLHMTIQTAVLIETLKDIGAQEVRWCSCNIFSTQDHAAAAVAEGGKAKVFAWKGESLREYWECTVKALTFEDGEGPSMIVDDGGDATLFLLEGLRFEREFKATDKLNTEWRTKENEDERELYKIMEELLENDPNIFTKLTKNLKGISEETTTGVMRLYQLQDKNRLLCPAINVNDSVTKSKFDNIYGCRHSLPDGIMRATDVMIAGKKVLICGYGDVGKGCASAMKNCGARVYVSEVDPICALQACMEGYQVVRLEAVVHDMDIIITATGNVGIVMAEHMIKMKNNSIVGNIGHFDNEIDMAGLKKVEGIRVTKIKDQVHKWIFPDGHGVIVLAEGRLLNLGCATGHPSFVMSNSFTNQVLAQIELWKNKDNGKYEKKVYKLSKELDEKVARLHLGAMGAELTTLTEEQAKYLQVPIEGPFKKEDYRY